MNEDEVVLPVEEEAVAEAPAPASEEVKEEEVAPADAPASESPAEEVLPDGAKQFGNA